VLLLLCMQVVVLPCGFSVFTHLLSERYRDLSFITIRSAYILSLTGMMEDEMRRS